MSPQPTSGFYVVLHFSMDGSGVNIAVGCSSSKFNNGYSIVLPPEEIDRRCEWARKVVLEERGTIDPFIDSNIFGATGKLPRSFERACALVKKIQYDEIEDKLIEKYLIEAAEMLQSIYRAQRLGRELSPADQAELEILDVIRPVLNARAGQGFGLNARERSAVELRAMAMAEEWLHSQGYETTNTSAKKPYDFEARADDDLLYVEVKGTTSEKADAIAMTHAEVKFHQLNKGRTALILVKGIKLTKDEKVPEACGGTLESILGWDIDTWFREPTAFRVSRQT